MTVAEFTLQGDGNEDFYDGKSIAKSYIDEISSLMRTNSYASVSLVDGADLPMKITNNVGCGVASCPVDLGPNCE